VLAATDRTMLTEIEKKSCVSPQNEVLMFVNLNKGKQTN